MDTLQASAPGKLIIIGEYAVVHGGPALSIAAGRRAAVTLQPAETSTLSITNSGDEFAFSISAGTISWDEDPGAQGSILSAAVAVLAEQDIDVAELGSVAIELCSRDFHETGKGGEAIKLGLGSSAAVTVALSGCLQQSLANTTTLDLALDVHRAHQGGVGSGIDVVTSYKGGCIALREDGQVAAVYWPDDLHLLPLWTGRAASTPQMLATLAEFAAAHPRRHHDVIGALAATAGSARYACDAGDVPALLALLDEYAQRLRELDAAAGIGIWSPEHQQLARLAADAGIIYKPSGAGGGDFGLAFSRDQEALAAFAGVCRRAGFVPGDFALGVAGLNLVE